MKSMILGEIPQLEYASVEAVNTLATNVTFSGSQYKSIMLTSCNQNEGKSYVAFHLVKALANLGYVTLLVDADLRKSVFFSTYDVRIAGQRTGLTHYLAGRCTVNDILYETNIPNMYMIPAGKEVINSLPLLTSPAFSQLLNSMKNNFDFIIVDAPPVGLVIDAAMIANACDATMFVVNNEQVSKKELAESVQQIAKSGCTLLGAVLNKVAMETHKSRKYYYRSYYSHYGTEEYIKKADPEEQEPRQGSHGKASNGKASNGKEPRHAAADAPHGGGGAGMAGGVNAAKASVDASSDAGKGLPPEARPGNGVYPPVAGNSAYPPVGAKAVAGKSAFQPAGLRADPAGMPGKASGAVAATGARESKPQEAKRKEKAPTSPTGV